MKHLFCDAYNPNESVQGTSCIPRPIKTVVSSLPLVPGKSPEFDIRSPQASQDTSESDVHYSEEHVDSNLGSFPKRATFVDVAVQCPPSFGDHRCDRSSRDTTPPGGTTHGAESVHIPPSQRYAQLRGLGRRQPPEERDDQDDAGEPQSRTPSPPTTQHDPKNPSHILKLLKRDVGGGATCVWQHGGAECGFSSQIDLVKRHIKRVHYRLRPCACKYCGRGFFNKYALSLHHNTHTGRKPFACNLCGKGFSTPSGKSHHRAHMHRRRFEEDGCST